MWWASGGRGPEDMRMVGRHQFLPVTGGRAWGHTSRMLARIRSGAGTKSLTPFGPEVTCLTFAPQSWSVEPSLFAGNDTGSISLWRCGSEETRPQGRDRAHSRGVLALSAHPVCPRIATCGWDLNGAGTAVWWDVASRWITDTPLRIFVGHESFVSCVDHGAEGSLLLTASNDSTIRIWDGNARDCVAIIPTPTPTHTARFHPSDCHIFVTAERSGAYVWDVRFYRSYVSALQPLMNKDGMEERRELPPYPNQKEWEDAFPLCTFGRDQATASPTSTFDSFTRRYEPVFRGHDPRSELCGACISPEGRFVYTYANDRHVCLWELATQRVVWCSSFLEPRITLSCCPDILSLDDRRLLLGGEDGRLVVCHATVPDEQCTLQGHEFSLSAVCFDEEGAMIASADASGHVKLHRADRTMAL